MAPRRGGSSSDSDSGSSSGSSSGSGSGYSFNIPWYRDLSDKDLYNIQVACNVVLLLVYLVLAALVFWRKRRGAVPRAVYMWLLAHCCLAIVLHLARLIAEGVTFNRDPSSVDHFNVPVESGPVVDVLIFMLFAATSRLLLEWLGMHSTRFTNPRLPLVMYGVLAVPTILFIVCRIVLIQPKFSSTGYTGTSASESKAAFAALLARRKPGEDAMTAAGSIDLVIAVGIMATAVVIASRRKKIATQQIVRPVKTAVLFVFLSSALVVITTCWYLPYTRPEWELYVPLDLTNLLKVFISAIAMIVSLIAIDCSNLDNVHSAFRRRNTNANSTDTGTPPTPPDKLALDTPGAMGTTASPTLGYAVPPQTTSPHATSLPQTPTATSGAASPYAPSPQLSSPVHTSPPQSMYATSPPPPATQPGSPPPQVIYVYGGPVPPQGMWYGAPPGDQSGQHFPSQQFAPPALPHDHGQQFAPTRPGYQYQYAPPGQYYPTHQGPGS